VLATHGRSVLVLDDISPLQQLTDAVLAENEHLFRPRDAVLWDEDKRTWHGGGDELFRAKNPPDAILSYYIKGPFSASSQGEGNRAKLQIVDAAGNVVRELEGSSAAGIHRIAWDLRRAPVQNAPGDRILPGNYVVKLIVNGRTATAALAVRTDPNR
jgi:hypothetical protein